MENKIIKPILKENENPAQVLHQFVQKVFKKDMESEIIFVSDQYFDPRVRVRITLPSGIFHEEDGRNKKVAKNKAALYIIKNWENLKETKVWVPSSGKGFWSVNDGLNPRSNLADSGSYSQEMISINNCFIDKYVTYKVIDKVKEIFQKYSPENNNWEIKDGETYYRLGSMSKLDIWKFTYKDSHSRYEYGIDKLNKFKSEEIAKKVIEEISKVFKEGRDLSTKLWIEDGEACEIDYLHKR